MRRTGAILPRCIFIIVLIACLYVPLLSALSSSRDEGTWQPTWSAAPQPSQENLTDQTIRMVIRSSISGQRVRIKISNLFGTAPLHIGSAHIALRDHDSAFLSGSGHVLLFHGARDVEISPAASIWSDPVPLEVPELADLMISLYIRNSPRDATMHLLALRTSYLMTQGNHTEDVVLPNARTTKSTFFLTTVDVETKHTYPVIAAFGDSITDGAHSTIDLNSSWPSLLQAQMLHARKNRQAIIVNAGIGGNRLVHNLTGYDSQTGLVRFERDVLNQPNLTSVVLLEGINDIGTTTGDDTSHVGQHPVTAEELIQAMQNLITEAHLRKIKIYGGTITPYAGHRYYSERGDAIRMAVNSWIRSSHAFDQVIDFDKELEDPVNKGHLLPIYDCGDHLHPSDRGYAAMATLAAKILMDSNK